jgi:hypothetical protein
MAEYLSIGIGGGSNPMIALDDVVITTHDAANTLHIGNNLIRSSAFPDGISLSNGRVGIGRLPTTQTKIALAHHFASYRPDGNLGLYASNNSVLLYDAKGQPCISMNAETGSLRCASVTFNALRSPDPATAHSFSICRVTSLQFHSDGTCALKVVNSPAVARGDRVLLMDVAVCVVMDVTYGIGEVGLLLFPIDCDHDFVVRRLAQSYSQTLFKLGEFGSRLLERRVVKYLLTDATVVYNGSVVTIDATTDSSYEISTLVDLTDTCTVGVCTFDDDVSPLLINVTAVVVGAGGAVTVTGVLRNSSFVNLSSHCSHLHMIANIEYLVNRNSDVFQIFDVSISFAVDANNQYHVLMQLPAAYGKETFRIIRESRTLYLDQQTLQVVLEAADSNMRTMQFAVTHAADMIALDRVTVGTNLMLGVIGKFAGLPLIVDDRYVADDGNIRVWTVETLPTLKPLMAQCEALNVLVQDGPVAYVGFVDFASPNVMILRTHQDGLVIPTGSRTVFIFPLAIGRGVTFGEPVSVSKDLCVSGNLKLPRCIEWGNPSQSKPNMRWGYSNASVFSVGEDMLQFTDIAEGYSNAIMQVRARGGMVVSSNVRPALAPIHVYETWGQPAMRSSNMNGFSIRTEGGIICMGGVHVPSDKRFKADMMPVEHGDAARAVLDLRVYSYVNSVGNREIGVLAQDAQQNALAKCAVATAEKAHETYIPVTVEPCAEQGGYVLAAAHDAVCHPIVAGDALNVCRGTQDAGTWMTVSQVLSGNRWRMRSTQSVSCCRAVVRNVVSSMLVVRHDEINALVLSTVQHLYRRTRRLTHELHKLRRGRSKSARAPRTDTKRRMRRARLGTQGYGFDRNAPR